MLLRGRPRAVNEAYVAFERIFFHFYWFSFVLLNSKSFYDVCCCFFKETSYKTEYYCLLAFYSIFPSLLLFIIALFLLSVLSLLKSIDFCNIFLFWFEKWSEFWRCCWQFYFLLLNLISTHSINIKHNAKFLMGANCFSLLSYKKGSSIWWGISISSLNSSSLPRDQETHLKNIMVFTQPTTDESYMPSGNTIRLNFRQTYQMGCIIEILEIESWPWWLKN